jgi:hypothetical protein
VPSLEGQLLSVLAISTPYPHHTHAPVRRRMSIALAAIVTEANFSAEGLLAHPGDEIVEPAKTNLRDLGVE